ncbi:alginate export family protein [Acetobacteraceae bacterium KSS8]|uniref:Alginate export family protein n=1 Tax=Endosaccharibacter trunci TaxID=2812733 RepID=A0ABT1W758_9PROT|nr:alginate export family protein [Acetobacteraceae bacterium KSS8]
MLRPVLLATFLLPFAVAPARAQLNPSPTGGLTRNPAEPAVSAYPAPAAGDGLSTAGYNLSRWAEDWRSMRDPKKRKDWLDRLKFLPLNNSGSVYLTLSGELRLRFNQTSNPNLKLGPRQKQDILRSVGGADLHIGPHLRAYAEIARADLWGKELGTVSGSFRNRLVFQQYFVEGDEAVGSVRLGLRYGRQEFTDGSNLLVSQRDNNTIRYVLNGVRLWVRGKTLRADLFDLHPTRLGVGGAGDDFVERSIRFSGVTSGMVVPRTALGGSKLYFDPFVWRLANDHAVWGRTNSAEERFYYGARLWGDAGRLTIDWTANYQGGRSGNRPIQAGQIFAAQTWKLGSSPTAPRIGFHADYASGGGAYNRGALHDAFAPFGNNIYYSYQLYLTPTNLIALAPSFTVSPLESVRITIEQQWTWRDSTGDAVYRANGTAFAGTQNNRARKVADVTRLQTVWTATPRLNFTGRYEHLAAGPALTRAGFAGSDFLAGWASYRF